MNDAMVIKWLNWLKNLVPEGSEQEKALNIAIGYAEILANTGIADHIKSAYEKGYKDGVDACAEHVELCNEERHF